MTYLKLIGANLLSLLLLQSCSVNSATNPGKDAATSIASPSTNAAGNASFLYKIDGKAFSGSGTDNVANCAFKKAGGLVHFILMSLDPTLKAPPQFSFSVAENGTTTITKEDIDKYSSGNNVTYFANFSVPPLGGDTPDYEFYSSITVKVTPGNSSRFTGTFSGNLINPATKKVAQLTDGNFDIPFSAHSK